MGSSLVEVWRVRDTDAMFNASYNKVSPHFIPQILTNMTAGLISIQFQAKVVL